MIESHRYYKSRADPQICSRVCKDKFTLMLIWTDNILSASSTIKGKILAKSELEMSYKIKDLGKTKLILGMHINRDL